MPNPALPGSERAVMARGRLFVLVGPSGAGKTWLVRALRQREPNVHYAITATTRAPRPGEQHGVDYFFYDDREFRELLERGAFVEYARFPPGEGRLYGTPHTQVTEPLENGVDSFVQVDVQGARSIRALIPDAVMIFLKPPDAATLRHRLVGRGTEPTREMEKRLETAIAELAAEPEFAYVVVNRDGELDRAVDEVCEIMRIERSRDARDRAGDDGR